MQSNINNLFFLLPKLVKTENWQDLLLMIYNLSPKMCYVGYEHLSADEREFVCKFPINLPDLELVKEPFAFLVKQYLVKISNFELENKKVIIVYSITKEGFKQAIEIEKSKRQEEQTKNNIRTNKTIALAATVAALIAFLNLMMYVRDNIKEMPELFINIYLIFIAALCICGVLGTIWLIKLLFHLDPSK